MLCNNPHCWVPNFKKNLSPKDTLHLLSSHSSSLIKKSGTNGGIEVQKVYKT